MNVCITEQACALHSKFLNHDAVPHAMGGAWFLVLFVLCEARGCCGQGPVCCRMFLDVLELVSV